MGTKLIIGLSVGGLLLLALGLIARFVYPLIYNNVSVFLCLLGKNFGTSQLAVFIKSVLTVAER